MSVSAIATPLLLCILLTPVCSLLRLISNAGRSGTYSEDFNGGSNANSNSINDAHGPANRLVITSHGPRNRDLIQDYFPRNLIQNHLDHFSGLFSRASAFTAHHPNLQNGFAPPHYHSRGTAFVTSSISSQVSTSGGQAALSFMSSQMSYESTSQTSVLGFAQASSTSSTLHTTSSGARGSGASQPSITINVYE